MPEDETKSDSYTPEVQSRPSSKRIPSDNDPNRGEEDDAEDDADEKQERRSESEVNTGESTSPNAERKTSQSGGKAKPAGVQDTAAKASATSEKRLSSDEESYEKVKKHLRDLVTKKTKIDRELEDIEERLYAEEGLYLQDANAGNVAKGFEHYTKGSQNRRKSVLGDQDRVFSVSSTSFDAES